MKLPANLQCITCFLAVISAVTAIPASPANGTDLVQTAFRNVGYFGNWDIYSPRNFKVQDIPTEHYTHLLYSFAKIDNSTGTVSLSDDYADTEKHFPGDLWDDKHNVHGNFKQLLLAKKKQPNLKTMLSIGGWTYSPNFNEILKSEGKRSLFASTAVKLMYNNGFDGLNLDWEHITTPEEGVQFVDLLRKIRRLMKEHANKTNAAPFLLSAAVTANPKHYKIMDLPAMDKYLDFWDFMAYDYASSWDETSGHQAALVPDSKNPSSTKFSTESAMDYYLYEGKIDPSKMNLGFPLYGHAFMSTDGPGKKFEGVGDGSHVAGDGDGKGFWDYKDLPLHGATVTELPEIGASYSYDAEKKMLVTYDTPNIAVQKMKWIKEKGLGGAMWWQVDGDKPGKDSIVAKVVKELGRLEKSKNHLHFPNSEYENIKNGMKGEGEEDTTEGGEDTDNEEEFVSEEPKENKESSTEVRIIASTSAVAPSPASSCAPAPTATLPEVTAEPTMTASAIPKNPTIGDDEEDFDDFDDELEDPSSSLSDASFTGLKMTEKEGKDSKNGKNSASTTRLALTKAQFALLVAGTALYFLL